MEKMEFGYFANVVTKKIREYLPESFSHAKITLQGITKTNGLKMTGLLIRDPDSIVCPIIYLDEYYKEYISGTDMGKILVLRLNHILSYGFGCEPLLVRLAAESISKKVIETNH